MTNELKTERLWAVDDNTDHTEGRGRQYTKHICRLKETAYRLAKKGYVQGTDNPVSPIEVVILDNGKCVLPYSAITIVEPTEADVQREQETARYSNVMHRAKELGLTDEEIETIKKGI